MSGLKARVLTGNLSLNNGYLNILRCLGIGKTMPLTLQGRIIKSQVQQVVEVRPAVGVQQAAAVRQAVGLALELAQVRRDVVFVAMNDLTLDLLVAVSKVIHLVKVETTAKVAKTVIL